MANYAVKNRDRILANYAGPVLPRTTEEIFEHIDRRLTGDGAPARFVRSMAAYGAFRGQFSEEASHLMAELAMYTGRRMPNQFGYQNSRDLVNADVNLLRERFETGPGHRTGVSPFAWNSSGKSSNTETNIGKSGVPGGGDSQDGD